ncbi:STAS-like domain-containing protein [Cupriavidus metallidurans]|uniref:STAS-like domain-containing protein n=1 Tax=Cupriavidus metallidurans TaxID=119219 RepID=UPI001CC91E35|nr:STAS-like domain-containing protein [Cupriavidus metallidurans]UBM10229.1 STAS-like domain-containing protein [Cupriavidus metallidurans]
MAFTQAVVFQDGPRIYVSGRVGIGDYKIILATLHQMVNGGGYQDIELDFSRCANAYPGGMLPICSYVMNLRNSRVDTELILPDDTKLANRFINTHWAHLIEPRKYDPPIKPPQNQIPALRFTNSTEQQECVNRVLETMLGTVTGLSRSNFSAVEWALNEVTDNVLNHAQSSVGGLVQLTAHQKNRRAIEYTVCDAGLGIPKTLRTALPELHDDIQALEQAVKEGVTRNKSTNQGNGLFGSFEICRVSGGVFRLHSGNAILELENGSARFFNNKIPFSGTLIDATINIADRNILDKALRFNGKVHQPSDLIEYKYEDESLKYVDFNMEGESRSFGSRAAAKPIKIKLTNLLEMCQDQIIRIDFSGVSVISSSFADEVFGMLFVELGAMTFMSRIRFTKTSPTITGLIDRAIAQRVRTGL